MLQLPTKAQIKALLLLHSPKIKLELIKKQDVNIV